ncbi:hypothetical protein KC325_g240 [Hortaea werneckii]|nr:hypothetical protein KC325_g240 [Hortaea werneckii]
MLVMFHDTKSKVCDDVPGKDAEKTNTVWRCVPKREYLVKCTKMAGRVSSRFATSYECVARLQPNMPAPPPHVLNFEVQQYNVRLTGTRQGHFDRKVNQSSRLIISIRLICMGTPPGRQPPLLYRPSPSSLVGEVYCISLLSVPLLTTQLTLIRAVWMAGAWQKICTVPLIPPDDEPGDGPAQAAHAYLGQPMSGYKKLCLCRFLVV